MRRALALAVAMMAAPVLAHDAAMGWKYDGWCCNGDSMTGDCQNIPDRSVKVTPRGYQVTLDVGDHRLVTKRHEFLVTWDKVRPSGDSSYHACLFPSEDVLRCFYAPPQGS